MTKFIYNINHKKEYTSIFYVLKNPNLHFLYHTFLAIPKILFMQYFWNEKNQIK